MSILNKLKIGFVPDTLVRNHANVVIIYEKVLHVWRCTIQDGR